MTPKPAWSALFLGGLLPIAAFALVEHFYGTMGGLIAGMIFGLGELTYEYVRFRKIQGITIGSNLMILILGGLSLIEDDPIFFKLQPALIVFVFAGLLIVSSWLKKPFLVALARKQNPETPEWLLGRLSGVNLRLGFCMLGLGALSLHAAYNWSTANWALLKGVGAPLITVGYMGAEVLASRLKR